MERIDRKREEDKVEEIVELLKENLPKEIFCFIIEKVLTMYPNCALT